MDFNLLRLGVTSANPWISTVVLNCGVLRVPVVHLLTRIVSQSRDLTCLWSPRGLAYRTAASYLRTTEASPPGVPSPGPTPWPTGYLGLTPRDARRGPAGTSSQLNPADCPARPRGAPARRWAGRRATGAGPSEPRDQWGRRSTRPATHRWVAYRTADPPLPPPVFPRQPGRAPLQLHLACLDCPRLLKRSSAGPFLLLPSSCSCSCSCCCSSFPPPPVVW